MIGHKLVIKNFAGISDAEIDVKPFNVYIGKHGTGKSVVAKLLYFLNAIPSIIFMQDNEAIMSKLTPMRKRQFEREKGKNELKTTKSLLAQIFRTVFEVRSFNDKGFEVTYLLKNDDEIKISKGKDTEIDIELPNSMISEFNKLVEQKLDKNQASPKLSYISKLGYSEQLFIPEFRAGINRYKRRLFYMLSRGMNSSYLLTEFGAALEQAEAIYEDANKKEFKFTTNFAKGKLVWNSFGQLNVHQNDGRLIPIEYTSSGQQQSIPLVLVLEALAIDLTDKDIYIEEPEAHVFPTEQKQIMELIAQTYNLEEVKHEFVITTHSPYVLTSLNILLHAGDLGKKFLEQPEKLKQLNSIKAPNSWLDINETAVNHFYDGTAKSIIDPNSGLIGVNQLDRVSEDIGEEMNQLLDLEFEG